MSTRVSAELVIVVVGVLIALWADGCYQRRGDRDLARQYLESLRQDVASDIVSLRTAEAQVGRRRAAAEAVLAVVEGSAAIEDPVEFLRQVDASGRFSVPQHQGSTYEDLVSTGNLRLLPQQQRRAVADYYRFRDGAGPGLRLQESRVWDDYLPLAVGAIPIDVQRWLHDRIFRRPGSEAPPEAAAGARDALEYLRGDPRTVAALKAVIRGTWGLDETVRLSRDAAVELLGVLGSDSDSN